MPIVHVNVWQGFGEEKARKLIQGITQVFVSLDIPEQAVQVVIQEIPKTHWGIGGQPASERGKEAQPKTKP